MSTLLRAMLVAVFAASVLAACSKEEAPEAAPAPADAAPATGGGYEPTPEERVPGITEPAAS